jgi:hypothetical protein
VARIQNNTTHTLDKRPMETMTPKPSIELRPDTAEHEIPGIRVPGTPDTASNGIEDNLMGKVGPDTGNQLPVTRPGGVDITPNGFGGDRGNGTRCVLHCNQASLCDMEKMAYVFALRARRAGMAYRPESRETHSSRDALPENRRTYMPSL